MRPLTMMNDVELEKQAEQLKRDVRDFSARAARVASTVSCEGREAGSDPLYQRLTSIRDFLREKLEAVEEERARRVQQHARRRPLSFGAALLEMCLPWRRAKATR